MAQTQIWQSKFCWNLILLHCVKTVKGFYFFTQFEVNNMLTLLTHLQNKSYIQMKQPKTQLKFTCSKSTIETFEEGVKYVER